VRKRVFDIVCSLSGLLVLSPVLLLLAVTIKLGSQGPIFYRGQRVGRYGKSFRIFKFRSMVTNAEQIGGSSTGDRDPRITNIGLFMRKCKLDELPQFLNVFVGQMSLVGPRPEVQYYVDQYTEEEKTILTVRPGITDWASIWNSDEGAVLASAEDPDKAYEEQIRPMKLKLQLEYAQHCSLPTDISILFFTLFKLVNRNFIPQVVQKVATRGGYPANMASMLQSEQPHEEYGTVTELPGHGATQEQLAMMHTRYQFAAQLCVGKDILELACGPGIGLGYLEKNARRVEGGDLDASLVEAGKNHYGSRLDVHVIDAQELPYEDASFDVILLLEAIYYLPEPDRFLREAMRVLRKAGVVMICSANCERLDFNPSPYTHKYFSAAELQSLLSSHGFEVEMYGGFRVENKGVAGHIISLLRNIAVKLNIIPKTMAWKIRLKRMFFGKLHNLPKELSVDGKQCSDLLPLDTTQAASEYKVIYAVGRRAA